MSRLVLVDFFGQRYIPARYMDRTGSSCAYVAHLIGRADTTSDADMCPMQGGKL